MLIRYQSAYPFEGRLYSPKFLCVHTGQISDCADSGPFRSTRPLRAWHQGPTPPAHSMLAWCSTMDASSQPIIGRRILYGLFVTIETHFEGVSLSICISNIARRRSPRFGSRRKRTSGNGFGGVMAVANPAPVHTSSDYLPCVARFYG